LFSFFVDKNNNNDYADLILLNPEIAVIFKGVLTSQCSAEKQKKDGD
jgi:hypothetical protein